eukprot:m.95197 g.95197  ORF g.95197 m.95197 type:complete len:973 (-) comp13483_c0_seq3:77-2995(-)
MGRECFAISLLFLLLVFPTEALEFEGTECEDLPCSITSTVTLSKPCYALVCVLQVEDGATLNVDPGVRIIAGQSSLSNALLSIIIKRGASFNSAGTVEKPVTFTSEKEVPGSWVGILVCGGEQISDAVQLRLFSRLLVDCGGFKNVSNAKAVIQNTRVWFGGVAQRKEWGWASITMVGTQTENTKLSHIEVAFSGGPGLTTMGGSANIDHLSVLFSVGANVMLTGRFSGTLSYVFCVEGSDAGGIAAILMEEGVNVKLESATVLRIPGPTGTRALQEMALEDKERFLELTGTSTPLIRIATPGDIFSDGVLQIFPEAKSYSASVSVTRSILWSFDASSCSSLSEAKANFTNSFVYCQNLQDSNITMQPSVKLQDPNLRLVASMQQSPFGDNQRIKGLFLDPRLMVDSPAAGFGAFGNHLWIDGLSILSEFLVIPDKKNFPSLPCGRVTTLLNITSGNWTLRCTLVIDDGGVLAIGAGVTIQAYPFNAMDDELFSSPVPTIIILRGGRIVAEGTETAPITLTSVLPESVLPVFGAWGGLVLCGKAPIQSDDGYEEFSVEGLTSLKCGGSNAEDNSGVLRHVRCWFAGHPGTFYGKELNGITFVGVGSGTRVSHVEAAFSQDDGIEVFGGTVDLEYISCVHNADDGLDLELGYSGTVTFMFAFVGTTGDKAIETTGLNPKQNSSRATIFHATLYGSLGDQTFRSLVTLTGSDGYYLADAVVVTSSYLFDQTRLNCDETSFVVTTQDVCLNQRDKICTSDLTLIGSDRVGYPSKPCSDVSYFTENIDIGVGLIDCEGTQNLELALARQLDFSPVYENKGAIRHSSNWLSFLSILYYDMPWLLPTEEHCKGNGKLYVVGVSLAIVLGIFFFLCLLLGLSRVKFGTRGEVKQKMSMSMSPTDVENSFKLEKKASIDIRIFSEPKDEAEILRDRMKKEEETKEEDLDDVSVGQQSVAEQPLLSTSQPRIDSVYKIVSM